MKKRSLNKKEVAIRNYCANDMLQSKQILERKEAEAAGLIYSFTKLREIMTDLGFIKAGLGEWKYNNIEVSVFTHGDFWVNVGETRVYSNNFKTLASTDLIEVLFNLMQKTT